MALNQQFLQLMVWLKETGHLAGAKKVVEIGAQQLNDGLLRSTADIEHLGRAFGLPTLSLPGPLSSALQGPLDPAAPHARSLFTALGFDYYCVDIDRSPQAIPLDLNFDSVPAHLKGQFQLVTNFGTTEHIANQLNAFKITHDLAGKGAIMVHELPAQGDINHGLINYHPKFFERLAHANRYDILFFDFRWSAVEPGLPKSVKAQIERFVDFRNRPDYAASPAALSVVLRKTTAAEFVPFADIPLGSIAPNRQIEGRYGALFRREDLLPRIGAKVRAVSDHARNRILRLLGRT